MFYRRHLPRVVAYLARATGDYELAADLAAEVFAAALVGARRYRATYDSVRWLLGIARNTVGASRRRGRVEARARRRLGFEPIAFEEPDVDRTDELLASLPPAEGAAVRARILEDRTYASIAAELQCSGLVARKRVSRGLARVRKELGEHVMDGYYDRLETQLRALTESGAHRRGRVHVMPLMAFAATMIVVTVVAGVFLGVRGHVPATQVPVTPLCTSADWHMTGLPAQKMDDATVAGMSLTTKRHCRLRVTIGFDLMNRSGAVAGAVGASVNSIAVPGASLQRRWAWRNGCGAVGPFWFRLSGGGRSTQVPVSPPPCVDRRQSTGFGLFELRSADVLGARGIATARFGRSSGATLTAIGNLLGVFGSRISDRGCGVDTKEHLLDRVQLFFDQGRFAGYEYSGRFLATPARLRVRDTIERARQVYGRAFTTTSARGGAWVAAGLHGSLTSPP